MAFVERKSIGCGKGDEHFHQSRVMIGVDVRADCPILRVNLPVIPIIKVRA